MERAPYLPEHAPPPPDPAGQTKGNAKRTLFLWVALIVLFLTIWQFLGAAERGPAPSPRCVAPCVEPSGPWGTLVIAGVPIALMILMVILFLKRFRASHSFYAEQQPAFRAIAPRRFGEAGTL